MNPSTTNLAMLTTAGATAIYLASRALHKSTKPQTSADLDPSDCIQPEDVVAVFDDIFLHMQSVLAQLSQQIQQIQMSGQSIPEPQLRQLLKSEFDRALLAKQPGIFDKHDVDADCLQEATWEFMEKSDQSRSSNVPTGRSTPSSISSTVMTTVPISGCANSISVR